MTVIIGILALIIIVLIANIKIVPQAHSYIVELLGAYHSSWGVGLHFKIPVVEKIVKKVSLKEQVVDFPPQPVITKDNVTMQIDTVVYFQITDPRLYTYGVELPMSAIENLTATTLRNIIGDMELDESLTSRDIINTKMRSILDEATDPWGIKINRVELKNIIPPAGEKKSAVLVAEGEKESRILQAEAEKQSQILKAEADKEAAIRVAEGEAQAIREVQRATADGLKMLNDSAPTDAVLTIKSLEAFAKAADGKATKIIIPSEIQGVAGLVSALKETVTEPDKTTK